MKRLVFASIALTALLVMQQAAAEGLRCNGDLALPGSTKISVLESCGLPVLTESFCKPGPAIVVGDGIVVPGPCQVVDQWTYNPGPGQFYALLQFEAGVVTVVRFAGRVR
jgi:hypothetical protein